MKVAVLGAGPAGLLSAVAAIQEGHEVKVFSPPKKSVIGGAQFLHSAIPGVTQDDPDFAVVFRKEGEGRVYEAKVYGGLSVPFISWDGIEDGQVQDAWELRKVYDRLWAMFEGTINPTTVTVEGMINLLTDFDLVVSSAPKPALCLKRAGKRYDGPCTFQAVGTNVLIGQHDFIPEGEIIYNGTKDTSWHRASKIAGQSSAEYGATAKLPPGSSPVYLTKPVSNTCDCWDTKHMLHVGRLGMWEKGVLVHHAYWKTVEALRAL